MYSTGIPASVLIAKLQALINRYGDREVFTGGGDYPEGVKGLALKLPEIRISLRGFLKSGKECTMDNTPAGDYMTH